MIINATIHNPDASDFDSDCSGKGGNDTYDNVFLLSCSEVDDYLDYRDRECRLTDYAAESILDSVILHRYKDVYGEEWIKYKEKETGMDFRSYVIEDWKYDATGGDVYWWWLRSPGLDQKSGTDICKDGSIGYLDIDNCHIGVRPVIWISGNSTD